MSCTRCLPLASAPFANRIDAFNNARFGTLRHGRLNVVFVHGREVVETVFLVRKHALDAVLDNRRLAHSCRRHRSCDSSASVLARIWLWPSWCCRPSPFSVVLTGGGADQEAAGLAVARCPGEIADPLEAKHGVERYRTESSGSCWCCRPSQAPAKRTWRPLR